jgi:hypothetical protein
MQPVSTSIENVPLPISMSCLENMSPDYFTVYISSQSFP